MFQGAPGALYASGCSMLQGAPCFSLLQVFTVLHLAGALRDHSGHTGL